MTRLFTGDYSAGNLLQWPRVQTKLAPGGNVDPALYTGYGQYPVAVLSEDKDCGYVARYEVRPGDIPFSTTERSEVDSFGLSNTAIGTTAWYAFSVKFDDEFPLESGGNGWFITNQWHDSNPSVGSPVISWGFLHGGGGVVQTPSGYWSLNWAKQDGNGPSTQVTYLENSSILNVPLRRGEWIDVKMQIGWAQNDTDGFVRVWIDNELQTLNNGDTTFHGRTSTPNAGNTYTYYKEGIYRAPAVHPTGIVYHGGFRMADSEDSL